MPIPLTWLDDAQLTRPRLRGARVRRGEIVVESEAGQGTTFTVELPINTNHNG